MVSYEYGRIARLAESLEASGIDPTVSAQIMAGGEDIRKSTTPEAKADWLREAMQRMDELLEPETRYAVREACACCLGGKRLELSKKIAARNDTLEERVRAANETRMVFGNSVRLLEDGRVRVSFFPEDQESFRCACLPKANAPLPVTYCYCCGGHVKHHLQIALGRRLRIEVESSALSSGGTLPCAFVATILE